ALRSVGGTVTVGLIDGAFRYAINASGDFRLDAGLGGGVGANCGAGIALALNDGDVSVPSFTPRCDANEGESDMGWLKTKLSSLSLNRFAYTPGQGFDFELQVDLAPWLPAIEGLELPRLTQVTVTQNGFSIPAVDVKIARPPFTLGGFGLKVTRVQLPAFTLSWNDWQVGSPNAFRFAVDAELTLPEFPGAGGACLSAEPIRITGAEIANGKFKAKLEERRFTPACAIELVAPDATGSGAAAGDGGSVATSGGTGSGATCGGGPGVQGMMSAANCMTRETILASLPPDWAARSGCNSVEELVDAQNAWSQLPGNVFQTYTTVKCPGPSVPSDWANPYTEPWSPPPLVEAQAWPVDSMQAVEAYRRTVRALQATQVKRDAALNRETWPCDEQCRERVAAAEKEYEEAKDATEELWTENDWGDLTRRTQECLALERQKQLMGAADGGEILECPGALFGDEGAAILNRMKARLGRPPDCHNEAPYAIRTELGIERQKQLLGAGGPGDGAFAGMSLALNECGKQAVEELTAVCKDPNAGPLLIQDRLLAVLGLERQLQLLGAADTATPDDTTKTAGDSAASSTDPWTAVIDCAERLEARFPGQGPRVSRVSVGTNLALAGSAPTREEHRRWSPDENRPSGPSASDDWTSWFTADEQTRDPWDATSRRAIPLVRAPPPPDSTQGGVRLEIERFGGELVIGFSPFFMVERVPEIEGSIVLPPLFQCADSTLERQPLLTKLRLGPRGEINGTITGFVPTCPLDLAAVRVRVTSASLTFSTASNAQSVVLSAAATATFTLTTTPVTGQGSVAIDLLRGRLLAGSLTFQGPFRLDLPREQPIFSFQVQTASLDSGGVHIDGRAELTLADVPPIGVTFDRVTINPRTIALTRGQVLFDVPFAFEVGIGTDGTLGWRAAARGAALGVTTGLRVDLPSRIALGAGGFIASGDGGARLVFDGRDVDSVAARFSA
ncbi:MAG: hypothetical protein OEY20_16000, partial [Gemmatimonadota bacterium]|nr:hypothetical protein [Gemmatimonadota bacterium]